MDTGERKRRDIFKKWLNGEEAHPSRGCLEVSDTGPAVSIVLSTHSPPDIR
jgi:hypothetical protein